METQTETSWVDLVEFDPITQNGFTVARVYLEEGMIRVDGDKAIVEQLQEQIKTELRDGMEFLVHLTKEYRNPYLLATGIQTGVLPKDFGLVEMNIVKIH